MENEQQKISVCDSILGLCSSEKSVSSLVADNPSLAPGHAWETLLKGSHHKSGVQGHTLDDIRQYTTTEKDIARAAQCGKWGSTKPSDLFLRIYHDMLVSLEDDPARAMVSPSLMGTSGVMPLTIISVIPDIARHMANVIVRADREVILATNYWQDSAASKFFTDAIRQLDRRAGQRGTRVVFKIIYDRGSPKQVFEPHYVVSEHEYTGKNVKLPHAHEIPNIDLQVMNFHQPVVGTFHSKYMIVDRRIAILQSNNIQDNDNLEMMVQMEGPIVDSMYDMALISWHNYLDPPLPTRDSPATGQDINCFGVGHDEIFSDTGTIKGHWAVVDREEISAQEAYEADVQPAHVAEAGPPSRKTSEALSESKHKRKDSAIHMLPGGNSAAGPSGQPGPPQRQRSQGDSSVLPQFPPTFSQNSSAYDANTASEVFRAQASVSASPNQTELQAINKLLNHTVNPEFPPNLLPGVSGIFTHEDEMTPLIPHRAHDPFPIAMACRPPYGMPMSHQRSVVNPQNVAWMAALKNARSSVFIQTPTLNAAPLLEGIKEACERGVDVYCYVCLGYNDTGELLPKQGGHNELVAHNLHTSLSPSALQHLHYYWYVARDQTKPLPQSAAVSGAHHRRSCHIKLMIVDGHIGIMGNGNQDAQSWYHSQEINVVIDSERICASWAAALRRNQNTRRIGALDRESGIWKDAEGKEAEGAMGVDPGRFSWMKGVVGAFKRVQGLGGF